MRLCFLVLLFLLGESTLIAVDAVEVRYSIIQKVLKKYKRAFTLLEVPPNEETYSHRLAHEFPHSVFVTIGERKHPSINNLIILNKEPLYQDIKHLSECEHFDVVLAFNISENSKDNWKDLFASFFQMGHNVFIEVSQNKEIEKYLLQNGAKALLKDSKKQSKLYHYEAEGKRFLQRKTWLMPPLKRKTHQIVTSYDKKELQKTPFKTKKTVYTSKWIPGINLLTFKMYSGSYPTKETVKEAISQLQHIPHTDWNINNMILQGKKIVFIDFNDPRNKPNQVKPEKTRMCNTILLKNHLKLMDIDDPAKVKEFFWNKIIPESGKNQPN